LVDDGEQLDSKLKIENFPAVIFKRGGDSIATHEGYISLSTLQQKVGILLSGSNFSDSSTVKSVKGLKSINPKELYNMGEHLLFYFTKHDCGHCKEITPLVKKVASSYHKVKFEQIEVTGNHKLHTSFGVNKVPALVFVHDGKVVGKHTGFIDTSNLERRLEEFAISNKKNIGNSSNDQVSIIDKDLQDPEKGRKIKDKTSSNKEEKA
jgi:thiol-disulfide isomerase/thioredoxin